jgi:hypothetical protein
MGCDTRWPKEEFGIVQPEFDPGNQRHTFARNVAERLPVV